MRIFERSNIWGSRPGSSFRLRIGSSQHIFFSLEEQDVSIGDIRLSKQLFDGWNCPACYLGIGDAFKRNLSLSGPDFGHHEIFWSLCV